MNDTTAIWFTQFVGKECRIIDHYEMSGEGLEHYVGKIQEK
jgi:RNase P/RNase MRP subunit p29